MGTSYRYLRATLLALSVSIAGAAQAQNTPEPSQLATSAGWTAIPLVTVGEAVDGYRLPGILDGIGARRIDGRTVRFYVNSELGAGQAYSYALDNGTTLTGARVSYVDVDRHSLIVTSAGLAYNRIVDRYGVEVTHASQINEGTSATDGFDRLCSSALFRRNTFNLADDIYFTGEETSDGQAIAVDVESGIAYVAPALGRAAFENVTMLETGDPRTVAILIGDDRQGAPLYLYVGRKGALGGRNRGNNRDFLDRNGLAVGSLFAWRTESGETTPQQFNGTGAERAGQFVPIAHYDPSRAGQPGYDAAGYANQATLDALTAAAGAFRFSRPEDLATNPGDGRQVAFASTGRGSLFPADTWGTTYIVDVEFGTPNRATLRIAYDGDDSGAGQFPAPDYGMRSPDNLDWAHDGFVYVTEDRSTEPASLFGAVSGEEASVWRLDPVSGELVRIAQIDRTAVPAGQVDSAPADLGNWESSGILDVTSLFGLPPNVTLLVADVQAHSLGGGDVAAYNLTQGGQLVLLARGIEGSLMGAGGGGASAAGAVDNGPALEILPNPADHETRVTFVLASAGAARVDLVDITGRVVATVADSEHAPGRHEVALELRDLPAGLYIVRLETGTGVTTRRVTVAPR